jgi:long-chain fatty acid transport protein
MVKKAIVTFILLTFLTATAMAGGVAVTAYGVRAVNLGGAYRALSNDWSGAYWNPAGLAFVKGWNVGLSTSFITPTAKLTLQPYEGHRFFGYTDKEAQSVPKTFIIPNAGFVYGMDNGLSIGFGVFVPFGLGATWDLYNPLPGFGVNADFPENDNVSDLAVLDFHATAAYQLSDRFSVGVGFGLTHMSISIEQTVITQIAMLNPLLGPLANAPSDHFPTQQKLEGSGTGFSATFGAMWKASDKLTIGLAGRWYSDVKLTGSVLAEAYFPSNPKAVQILTAMKDAGQLDPATYQQAAMLFSGTKQKVVDDGDVEASVPFPVNLGIGIAYQATEKLLVAFDAEWTQWSSWDVIQIKNLTDLQGNPMDAELVENWSDGIRYNVGLEYNVMKTEDRQLDLRLGYYFDPSPIPPETITPSIPDANKKHSFIVGFGYGLGKLQLDASFSYFIVPDREVTGWVLDETGGNENFPGTYKINAFEFHVGLGYSF